MDALQRATPPREVLDGIDIVRYPNLSNGLAWRRQLFLPRGTGKFLRERLPEFDLVHLHMYRTTQNVAVHRYASRYRIPYVFSARGTLPRIVRYQRAKAFFDVAVGLRLLRDASRCVALSRAEREQYEAMGVPSERIRTIFNGIDWESFQDMPPRGTFAGLYGLEGKRLVAYIGRLHARKGLDHLLRAFTHVAAADGDTALVMAGPDEGDKRPLEALARSLTISDRITFPGLLTGRDRLALFVDASVVVYPAKHEFFGLVPFEALACGKPVVVADDSGCGEIIRGARAGLVVRAEDASQLSGAILTSLEKGPEISQMVERGRRFVAERLSWRAIADETERAYRETVAAREGGTPVS
jgi:glycosyltransferase involved in cell wall biosynthesis